MSDGGWWKWVGAWEERLRGVRALFWERKSRRKKIEGGCYGSALGKKKEEKKKEKERSKNDIVLYKLRTRAVPSRIPPYPMRTRTQNVPDTGTFPKLAYPCFRVS